jgi:hypothetical protein
VKGLLLVRDDDDDDDDDEDDEDEAGRGGAVRSTAFIMEKETENLLLFRLPGRPRSSFW